MTSFVLLSFIPTQLKAETEKSAAMAFTTKTIQASDANAEAVKIADAAEESSQMARLEEIKTMDKSELTASEKKELREEVRSIQQDEQRRDRDRDRHDNDMGGRHHHNGGIFITVGGGLLIILLLLLLL